MMFICLNVEPPPTKRLKLPQKLWVKKCCFLSGTSKIVSVTAQGQFQVHDTKLGTKPILNVKLCDEAFQTMFIDQSKQRYAYLGNHLFLEFTHVLSSPIFEALSLVQ